MSALVNVEILSETKINTERNNNNNNSNNNNNNALNNNDPNATEDTPSNPTSFAVRTCENGTCVLSGVKAPTDVAELVILRGTDNVEYTISKSCLQRYSRQIYVFGIAAMAKMMNSNVLLCGLSGLGIEIAKNVILAGVKSFTIYDNKLITSQDLASNFYTTQDDNDNNNNNNDNTGVNNIGKKRTDVCIEKLRELNPLTPVDIYSFDNLACTKDGLGQYSVCVYVDGTLEELKRVSNYCHINNICFIATSTYGLYGYAFSDFGEQFKISDTTGENPRSGIICGLQLLKNNDNVVDDKIYLQIDTDPDVKHGLNESDKITLSGIKCLNGLPQRQHDSQKDDKNIFSIIPIVNEMKNADTGEVERKIISQTSFKIDITSYNIEPNETWVKNTSGGYWNEVKQHEIIKHQSFNDAIEESDQPSSQQQLPSFVQTDLIDFSKPMKLHSFLKALLIFETKYNRCTIPGNVEDARKITTLAMEEFKKYDENINNDDNDVVEKKKTEKLYMSLALGASGQLSPMAAFFGGIVGQEVVKACSGKYVPLNQWLHFESSTSLPRLWSKEEGVVYTEEQVKPTGSRYDGQIAVFGKDFQNKLANSSIFLVGSGALGCEFMKNFAMIGIGCKNNNGNNGKIHVTDMDTVEVSNLNRQFLFRDYDVGQMKSTVAVKSISNINKNTNAIPHVVKVAPETENMFNDTFWEEIDIVVNALDNVEARKYVDSRCSFYRKPLFESGTLGTKANVQPIIPSLTEGYSDGPNDQPEVDIPVCTLKSFPYMIEHTLAWAKEKFFTEFYEKPLQSLTYMKDRALYISKLQSKKNSKLKYLRYVKDMVGSNVPKSFEDCIAWARIQFDVYFNHTIVQLLSNYPADKLTNDGTSFWAGKKKCPTIINFDMSNANHRMFIIAAANLRANIFHINKTNNEDNNNITEIDIIMNIANNVTVPEFTADKNLKIAANEKEAKELGGAEAEALDSNNVETLFLELIKYVEGADQYNNYQLEEFEKDDDTNYHMDFITATSNIRANSYHIPEADKMRSAQIVGRIIPAVATTTALTTGAVMLEIYKYLNHDNYLNEVSNNNSNKKEELINLYKSSNFNLAINAYYQFEPAPADAYEFNGKTYTTWDTIDIDHDMTLEEFRDWFENDFLKGSDNTSLSLISTHGSNPITIYNDFLDDELIESRNGVLLSNLVKDITGEDLKGNYLLLSIDVDVESDDESDDDDDDSDEDEAQIPLVRIRHSTQ